MIKKYFPYILLIAAAVLLWFIKANQRNNFPEIRDNSQQYKKTEPVNISDENNLPFDRHTTQLIYTKHALCRMDCRHIDKSEVLEILEEGIINYDKIEKSDRGKSYPLEGVTHDKQHVRIVFAPKKEKLVVVTVIDLDRDWYCDCK